VNDQAVRLLGLPGQGHAWLGRDAREAVAARPALATAALAWERLQGADQPGQGVLDGPEHALRWSSVPVPGPDGAPLGRLLVLSDVTEERAVARLREDLTQMLVHDLRNPLTSVVGSIEMLEGHPPREMADRFLGVARLAADRMLALVNGILELSRLEHGEMPLALEAVDLDALVADTVQLFAPQARERDTRLMRQVAPDTPAVRADRGILGRVLQNLVGNALKFTPVGGQVRITATAAGDGVVSVRVADDGPGIPAALRPRLFQRFASGRQRESGTGLGLAFCRLAVEAHGGRIHVEGGPGTTMAFTLPRAT